MKEIEGRIRVVIESVAPEIDSGYFPVKRAVGEKVAVEADIFADGHDSITARLLYKKPHNEKWQEAPMIFIENDRWRGEFIVEEVGIYTYTLMGWVDHFKTWQNDLKKRVSAGQDIGVDILMGAEYIEEASKRSSGEDRKRLQEIAHFFRAESEKEEIVSISLSRGLSELMDRYPDRRFAKRYDKELSVVVDRPKALFSTWYELFPRSCPYRSGNHGTLKDCETVLPEIARMGFDILYLPPIHPVGKTNRKGRNNVPDSEPDDVGSPWAIGSEEGGHKSIHPALGTMEDFQRLIERAGDYGIEVAMDLAFQCSPDHPYVKEHPEWFKWRPDGTVQFAENPPKKYEDILPLNFETENCRDLWDELRSVVLFWIERGIRVFRVDNPHTKPFPFWGWLIKEIKRDYPDVIFLSEAFTRPKVMYHLAKLGFTQSYTYFAWRNTKWELTQYINELAKTNVWEYFRPNFWPNTPDILPEHLQYGGRNAFMMRLVLAATLSSNYGIYGPAFELCINEAVQGKEEYLNSEKYELKNWDWDREGNLKDFIARVNKIRRENPALQSTFNIEHYEVDNDNLFFYGKYTDDFSNIILVIVNLDPFHVHSGRVKIPVHKFGIEPHQPYLVHDLLGDDKFIWQGERNYVEINPYISPAYILRLRKKLKREMDFDYFM
ncbi:MAG: alpha-1,4-glucan--maltose-1-phosphate maltosyltransferase [Nitrospirae bacterium]|jgi:starch synthase (maltosyl-transferring)|nr:alpha-1,4-glucan--maltose-1-phosphate maltosyltransferase [Nitrospirota bacterium]